MQVRRQGVEDYYLDGVLTGLKAVRDVEPVWRADPHADLASVDPQLRRAAQPR
jgi:hypothetical protein